MSLVVVLCASAQAAPQVRQLDPPRHALLGQSVFWVLQVRHKLWESYDLTLQPPAGAQMEIENSSFRRSNDDLITIYRVRFVPQKLAIGGPPAAVLTDLKGERFLLRGKSIAVDAISGNSLDVRAPLLPRFQQPTSGTKQTIALIAIAGLLLALIIVAWRRRLAMSPQQMLFRHLAEVRARIGTPKPPDIAWLCILLRSDLLWGESVDAITAAELVERGKQTQQHEVLCGAIEKLEEARYSGNVIRDPVFLEQTVKAAMEILEK